MVEKQNISLFVTVHHSALHEWEVKRSILIDMDLDSLRVEDERNVYILGVAADVLSQICWSLLSSNFSLLISPPPDIDLPEVQPRLVRDIPELPEVIEGFVRHAENRMIYPSSIWGIPAERVSEARRIINTFETLRMDGALFDDFIRLGGARIALWPSSIDLSIGYEQLEDAIDWIKHAASHTTLPVSWRDEA